MAVPGNAISPTALAHAVSEPVTADEARPFLGALPAAVWGVAVLAALLHLAPLWHAQAVTPAGWQFTGNTRLSPDFMQYRVWARDAQRTGLLVRDRFTTEPNRPHLPVAIYWLVGQIDKRTGAGAEFVASYLGAVFASAFTILLFAMVRLFLPRPYQTWCVFLAILFGGGFGTHLRVISDLGPVEQNFILRRTIVDGIRAAITWETLRWPYPIVSLFDSHFLIFWTVSTGAIAALYFAIRTPSAGRLALAAALCSLITLLHVYEGITLMCVMLGIAVLCWYKQIAVKASFTTLIVSGAAVSASFAVLWLLYRRGGLPVTSWRAPEILVSSLLLAHPVAWALILPSMPRYWRNADLDAVFLLGWLLGCVALTFSAPYYPYADRGTMTLAIPVCIVAGAIYFARHARLSPAAIAVVIVCMGVTPVWVLQKRWKTTEFSPSKPYMFMSPGHQAIVRELTARAGEDDVLIADEEDLLWIAPEYPGLHYCAHSFLTVDYEKKRRRVATFFAGGPPEQSAFLRQVGARFVYVDAKDDPARFTQVPGLRLISALPIGSLFQFGSEP